METSDSRVAQPPVRVELKSATAASGALFVMISGTLLMPP